MPEALVFVGALLAAIGAFWGAVQESNHQRELAEKNERIAELAEQIAGSVTGGESFAYLSTLSIVDRPDQVQLAVSHHGDHPVYEVSIRIKDVDAFERLREGKTLPSDGSATSDWISDSSATTQGFEVGTLPPEVSRPLPMSIDLSGKDSIRLSATITARNGFTYQDLRWIKVDGEWEKALSVRRAGKSPDDSARVVLEEVTDGFPRDSTGEIEW